MAYRPHTQTRPPEPRLGVKNAKPVTPRSGMREQAALTQGTVTNITDMLWQVLAGVSQHRKLQAGDAPNLFQTAGVQNTPPPSPPGLVGLG
jgi:hypothetical protein